MKKALAFALTLAFCFSALTPFAAIAEGSDLTTPVKVLCVGDSITWGSGSTGALDGERINTYPDRLRAMLPSGSRVDNYSVSGLSILPDYASNTVSYGGVYDHQVIYNSYNRTDVDIVILMFGTNDAKREGYNEATQIVEPAIWEDEFTGGYQNFFNTYTGLIRRYQQFPSQPTVYCMIPPPVLPEGTDGRHAYRIDETILKDEIIPCIRAAAASCGCPVIDLREAFPDISTEAGLSDALGLYVDCVHPNPDGYALLAQTVYAKLNATYQPYVPLGASYSAPNWETLCRDLWRPELDLNSNQLTVSSGFSSLSAVLESNAGTLSETPSLIRQYEYLQIKNDALFPEDTKNGAYRRTIVESIAQTNRDHVLMTLSEHPEGDLTASGGCTVDLGVKFSSLATVDETLLLPDGTPCTTDGQYAFGGLLGTKTGFCIDLTSLFSARDASGNPIELSGENAVTRFLVSFFNYENPITGTHQAICFYEGNADAPADPLQSARSVYFCDLDVERRAGYHRYTFTIDFTKCDTDEDPVTLLIDGAKATSFSACAYGNALDARDAIRFSCADTDCDPNAQTGLCTNVYLDQFSVYHSALTTVGVIPCRFAEAVPYYTDRLIAAYEQALSLDKDEYSKQSWADFQAQLAGYDKIIQNLDRERFPQSSVDSLTRQLEYDRNILKYNDYHAHGTSPDLSGNQSVRISIFRLKEENYFPESWANLQTVLQNNPRPNTQDPEMTQDRIDENTAALRAAMDALEADPEKGFTFSVSDGYATVTGYSGVSRAPVIPAQTPDGYPVTAIGSNAFAYSWDLTTITIPDTVTTIGASAFRSSSLVSVTIPDSVQTIGSRAFDYCHQLKSVVLPATLKAIPDWCFNYANNLNSITIPEGVESIGENAFSSCYGLFSVNLPETLKTIGNSAFSSCASLTSITIPEGVEALSSGAFAQCTALSDVTLPQTLTFIGYSAFSGCSNLRTLHVPASVTQLDSYAFASLSGLRDLYIYGSPYFGNEVFNGSNPVLHGYRDSSVETYAQQKNLRFKLLSDPGDLNGDRIINVLDLTMLAKHLAGWEPDADFRVENADCNLSGAVNIADLELLAKFLAGWEVSLGV